MLICNILLALGAFMLIVYIREKLRKYSIKATILKATVSLIFISLAVCAWFSSAGAEAPDPFGIFVVLGLVCGLLGDVWLDLKYVYREDDTVYTYAGFASFALGHVLYISGLLLKYYEPGMLMYVIAALVLSVVLSFGNALLEKPMKLDFGKFRPVVIGYGILLFATLLVSGSLSVYFTWKEVTLTLFFAGGVLFALSDLILSGTFFGVGKERAVDIILNYLTYYPAQFLIAYSLLFI